MAAEANSIAVVVTVSRTALSLSDRSLDDTAGVSDDLGLTNQYV